MHDSHAGKKYAPKELAHPENVGKPGDKVRFLNVDGFPEHRKEASKILNLKDTYTVESIYLGFFYNTYCLVEFPAFDFNMLMFKIITE